MKAFFFLLILLSSTVYAQQPETGFLKRSVTIDSNDYCYQVFVPKAYTPMKKWPVILFLHGLGEGGADCSVQTEVGIGPAIRRQIGVFPAIVVFPQAPRWSLWIGALETMALKALEQTIAEFNTDPTRVYLTGLSLGGYGAWYLAAHHPNKFAALAPVAGGILPPQRRRAFPPEIMAIVPKEKPYETIARQIGKTPVWIFHGAEDPRVPASESRTMHEALKATGGNVRYTEYPGVAHNSWDKAYAEPGFFEWLFLQRLHVSASRK
ncbi:MAG: prolyl oligopeptidase family serine peptidase [bacterium]